MSLNIGDTPGLPRASPGLSPLILPSKTVSFPDQPAMVMGPQVPQGNNVGPVNQQAIMVGPSPNQAAANQVNNLNMMAQAQPNIYPQPVQAGYPNVCQPGITPPPPNYQVIQLTPEQYQAWQNSMVVNQPAPVSQTMTSYPPTYTINPPTCSDQPVCPPAKSGMNWGHWFLIIVIVVIIVLLIGWFIWWLINRGKAKSALGGSCSNSSGCQSGLTCSSGTCKYAPGHPCISDNDCSTADGAAGKCLPVSSNSTVKVCAAAVSGAGGVCNSTTLCNSGLTCVNGTCQSSTPTPGPTPPLGGPLPPGPVPPTTTQCITDNNCPSNQVCQYDPIHNMSRCVSLPLTGQRCSVNGVCSSDNSCGPGMVINSCTGNVKFCTDLIGLNTQVLDAFNYLNEPYFVLGNGQIYKQSKRELTNIQTDRMMERIVPFGTGLVGISQGQLYETSHCNNGFHWRLAKWPNLGNISNVYSISSTLDGQNIIVQIGNGISGGTTGHIYQAGSSCPQFVKTVGISGRSFWVMGSCLDNYLVINPVTQTAIRYPDGQTVNGIVDGLLSSDNKIYFYGTTEAKTVNSIRMLYVSCAHSGDKCKNKGCKKMCPVDLVPYLLVARLCHQNDHCICQDYCE